MTHSDPEIMPVSKIGHRQHDDGLGPNETISRKLRELYDSVKEEAIPDRFLDLLERLDAAEQDGREPQQAEMTDNG